ncbi:MAG: response regulator [Myxococcales bacterium]|nr:response regulator [Myxococcales bacterium]
MSVRIYVIDDEVASLDALKDLLAEALASANISHVLRAFTDGEAGLAAAAEEPPHIVITDLLMPRFDGFRVCKGLRAMSSGAEIELFAVSGIYRTNAVREKVNRDYQASFFAKPAELRELTKAVLEAATRFHGVASRGAAGGASGSKPASASPAVMHAMQPPTMVGRASPAVIAAAAAAARSTKDKDVSSGDLSDRGLPSILLDLSDRKATGRLSLRRGAQVKSIDLSGGQIVAIHSSSREETLGQFLLDRNVINETQYKKTLADIAKTQRRAGEVLVALGILSLEQLTDQLLQQLHFKLAQVMRWPQAQWRFDANAPVDDGDGMRVGLAGAVMRALRDTASGVLERMSQKANVACDINERGRSLLSEIGGTFGFALADALAKPFVIGEVLAKRGEPGAQAIDALVMVDGLQVAQPLELMALRSLAASAGRTRAHSDPPLMVASPQAFNPPSSVPGRTLPKITAPNDAVDKGWEDNQSTLNVRLGSEEAGVIHAEPTAKRSALADEQMRRELHEEVRRTAGLDFFHVVELPWNASQDELVAALATKRKQFSRLRYRAVPLGADQGKLDTLVRIYDRAEQVLLDPRMREQYIGKLSQSTFSPEKPSVAAEQIYRDAIALIGRRQWPAAIEKLTEAIALAPVEADYHAELGHAYFEAGGESSAAAALARPHLEQALSIAPDHARAHAWLGRMLQVIGGDLLVSIFHFERSLTIAPTFHPAATWLAHAIVSQFEKTSIPLRLTALAGQLAVGAPVSAAEVWAALGSWQLDVGMDVDGARASFTSALTLVPNHGMAQALIAQIEKEGGAGFVATWREARETWAAQGFAAATAKRLVAVAASHEQHDATFLAAAAASVVGNDEADVGAALQRLRPKYIIRANAELGESHVRRLAHGDDTLQLDELMNLLAPVVEALAPLTPKDLGIAGSEPATEQGLSANLLRVRDYVAGWMGAGAMPIFIVPSLGREIIMAGLHRPALLVGPASNSDEADRYELVFRFARALSYRSPARHVGGSRSGRVLREALIAALLIGEPSLIDALGVTPQRAQVLATAMGVLAPALQRDAGNLATRLIAQNETLNMSAWSKSLSHTANRIGVIACGDLHVAKAVVPAAELPDLLQFWLSPEHLALRAELGLSIDG